MDAITLAAILGLLAGCVVSNALGRVERYFSRQDYLRREDQKLIARVSLPVSRMDRDETVLRILRGAPSALTPTEIAFVIGEPWAKSNSLVPILRRIGAKHHKGGLYSAPESDDGLNVNGSAFYTDRPHH